MTFLSASAAPASSSSSTSASTSGAKPKHLYPSGAHRHMPTHTHPHPQAGSIASTVSSSLSRPHTPTTPSNNSDAALAPPPSTSQSQSAASTQSLPLKPHHGVRAHLAELLPLPRHALFDVKLTIHQLWNVPLVSGEFSVKWKFSHVHRARRPGTGTGGSSNGLTLTPNPSTGRLTPDSSTGTTTPAAAAFLMGPTTNVNGKGKGREVVDTDAAENDNFYNNNTLTPSGASMLSIPSTSEGSSSSPSLSPRTNSMELPNLPNSNESEASRNDINRMGVDEHANGIGHTSGSGTSGSSSSSHEARGRTPYVALHDHNVKWGQTVHVTVQIGIQRDTQELQPCELKLTVEQLSNPTDHSHPRLGAVYLNLAEYVNKGSVTRRYLLRQSKTNATLQLTLELSHAGGESSYRAPPLQKGEVMAGVSALLEKSAVGGTPRPRPALTPAFERAASGPVLKTHRRATDRGAFGMPMPTVLGGGGGGIASELGMGVGVGAVPGPGVGKRTATAIGMGGGGGLKTTDNIIEAIFNPVPTSSLAPSPFTYYVPPKPRPVRPLPQHAGGAGSSSPRSPVSPSPLSAVETCGRSVGTGSGSASGSGSRKEDEIDLSTEGDELGGVGGLGGDEDGRPPSIAPSLARSTSAASAASGRSLTSLGTTQTSSSTRDQDSASARSNVSMNTGGKKWWKKLPGVGVGGSSKPASPSPSPQAQHQPPSSVRSSPGALHHHNDQAQQQHGNDHIGTYDAYDEKAGEGAESDHVRGGIGPENWPSSAPQIVVRSPTSATSTSRMHATGAGTRTQRSRLPS